MNELFGINSNERFYDGKTNDEDMVEGGSDYYDEIDHDDEKDDDEEKELSDEDGEDTRVHLSFACDDCDYRWDDIIVGNKEKIEREEFDLACPMCGSIAITQI
jgi:hypothetical protein